MRQITFLVGEALERLSQLEPSELLVLQGMAADDFAEAFRGLCKAESEERNTEFYWKQTLEEVRRDPVPYDNENVHAVTHVEKHANELDKEISKERWEYLIESFGRAMRLSAQLYLECQKWLKKKS